MFYHFWGNAVATFPLVRFESKLLVDKNYTEKSNISVQISSIILVSFSIDIVAGQTNLANFRLAMHGIRLTQPPRVVFPHHHNRLYSMVADCKIESCFPKKDSKSTMARQGPRTTSTIYLLSSLASNSTFYTSCTLCSICIVYHATLALFHNNQSKSATRKCGRCLVPAPGQQTRIA